MTAPTDGRGNRWPLRRRAQKSSCSVVVWARMDQLCIVANLALANESPPRVQEKKEIQSRWQVADSVSSHKCTSRFPFRERFPSRIRSQRLFPRALLQGPPASRAARSYVAGLHRGRITRCRSPRASHAETSQVDLRPQLFTK